MSRAETYVIRGRPGSGDIVLNGAIARLVQVEDLVIVLSYAWMDLEEARHHVPVVVHVDGNNRILQSKP